VVNLRREMIQGLVRLRILRAATRGPISGVELSEDLASAGHRVSPGTLYPLLHDLEKAGWLKSKGRTVKGKRRRYYRVTKKGRAQLEQALMALNQFLFDGLEPLPVSAALMTANDGTGGTSMLATDTT
jgi:PadR family transcriptional regulator, regulatory protein PadR